MSVDGRDVPFCLVSTGVPVREVRSGPRGNTWWVREDVSGEEWGSVTTVVEGYRAADGDGEDRPRVDVKGVHGVVSAP